MSNVATAETARPSKGMFSRGSATLDPRLFDGDRVRPEVREALLNALDGFWRPLYGDWPNWARVYIAGSAASYWWDSDTDLDVLIGIDKDALDRARPQNIGVREEDICLHLNKGLKEDLGVVQLIGLGATFYVNPGSFDIRPLHPYAAYDLTGDGWVVRPPALPPDWGPDAFPEGWWDRAAEMATEVDAIMALPEPERSLQGVAYFNDLHHGRQKAYSLFGMGWVDWGNFIYQYLAQTGHLRRLYLLKHPIVETPTIGDREAMLQVQGREADGRVLAQQEGEGRSVFPVSSLQVRDSSPFGDARATRRDGVSGLRRGEGRRWLQGEAVSRLSPEVASRALPQEQRGVQGIQSTQEVAPGLWDHAGAVRPTVDETEGPVRPLSSHFGSPEGRDALRGPQPSNGRDSISAVREVQRGRGDVGGRSQVGPEGDAVHRGLKHPDQVGKTAAVYRYEVGFATDKDSLKAGNVDERASFVEVEADSELEARLLAEQMVACHGEPTSIHRLALVTAMPSWRALSNEQAWWHDYDAIIATDVSGSKRVFDVYTHGEQVAIRHTLAEAKQYVEDVYGPLTWRRERMPRDVAIHYYFGPTTEFTDPISVLVVDRLPKLGKIASTMRILPASPLDYYPHYRVNTRIAVIDGDDFDEDHPYFKSGMVEPGTVAFVDLDVRSDTDVAIAFLTVRGDQRGRGHARRLIEEVYSRWPRAEVHWGKLMHDAMDKLYDEYREKEPDRTVGGSR